jgi:mannose-6-phosphate isomerase-like protein (cupin superfamily)
MAETIVARKADEGTALWVLGGLYEVKVSADESGGRMTVMEFTVPVGMAPPPHTHEQAEVVYVLEGTANFHISGETVEAGPGSCMYFPAGTPETFEPTGPGPVRVLVVYTPGGMDKFFSMFGETAATRTVPPAPDSPPDVERLISIGAQYGLKLAE